MHPQSWGWKGRCRYTMSHTHDWYYGTKYTKEPKKSDPVLKPRRLHIEKSPSKKATFDATTRAGMGKKFTQTPEEAISFLLSTCAAPVDITSDTCRNRIRNAVSRTSKASVLAFYAFIKSLEDTHQDSDGADDREDDEHIDMKLVHQIVNEVANETNDYGVDGLRGLSL